MFHSQLCGLVNNAAYSCVSAGFKERPEDFANILYIARIAEWSAHSKFPRGYLIPFTPLFCIIYL